MNWWRHCRMWLCELKSTWRAQTLETPKNSDNGFNTISIHFFSVLFTETSTFFLSIGKVLLPSAATSSMRISDWSKKILPRWSGQQIKVLVDISFRFPRQGSYNCTNDGVNTRMYKEEEEVTRTVQQNFQAATSPPEGNTAVYGNPLGCHGLPIREGWPRRADFEAYECNYNRQPANQSPACCRHYCLKRDWCRTSWSPSSPDLWSRN